jgi:hypothetical protein
VAIKDSADQWARGKPMRALLVLLVVGLVLGGLIGSAAGYEIEHHRVASGLKRLRAQTKPGTAGEAGTSPVKTGGPGIKTSGLANERVGVVSAIGANEISVRTARLGVLQVHTTSATQFELAKSGSRSDIAAGSRGIVTLTGDLLVLGSKSLLGRAITGVAADSFSVEKVNGSGTTSISFSKLKVIDVLSAATLTDVKIGSEVLVGGRSPSKGDFVAAEVVLLPAKSPFAK